MGVLHEYGWEGRYHAEQGVDCVKREATRRRRGNGAGEIGHGERDESLNAGIEFDHAGATEMGIRGGTAQRQGQAIECMP